MSRDLVGSSDAQERIGPYILRRLLGEGGMGVVYLAEQTAPIKRDVALKVIRPGMITKDVVRRFEIERQALAVMDHPNIAKVFAAGATDDGRPFFVMELVQGQPLTRFCDEKRLSLQDRLELFVLVCRAVQHAHQKGVIHRDLKPNNILVADRDGVITPKVIDFGIAKAIAQELSPETILTQTGLAIGTPAYMSPEQVGGEGVDIDTRSDIYALGMVLYELLVGRLPFDDQDLSALSVLTTILAKDPPRPSTRFAALGPERHAIAERRDTDPPTLQRRLGGDIGWIAVKALEKDRERRYETANGLALDVERYLRSEPVLARAPNVGYRVQKFVRRHMVGVSVAALLAVVLLASSILVSYWAITATRASAEADLRRTQAENLIGFMVEDLRERLARLGQLDVLDTVGAQALAYITAIPEDSRTPTDLYRHSQILYQIGDVRLDQGDRGGAEEAWAESLKLARQLANRDPDNAQWQFGLGQSLFYVGYLQYLQAHYDAALVPFLEYRDIANRLVAIDSDNVEWQLERIYANSNVGSVLERQGDLEGALEAFRASLLAKEKLMQREPDNLQWQLNVAIEHNKVGLVLDQLGDLSGALDHHRADLAIAERLVAQDSSDVRRLERLSIAHYYLATRLDKVALTDSALEHYRADLEIARLLNERDPDNAEWVHALAESHSVFGQALLRRGSLDQAAWQFLQSRRLLTRLLAVDSLRHEWKRALEKVEQGCATVDSLRLMGTPACEG